MQVLNNADFLTLWENGHRLHPLDRGLLAIRASLPNGSVDPIADWPVGRRNRALAEIRVLYFGPKLGGWTTCDVCGEKLEFAVDCRAIAETPDTTADGTVDFHGSVFRLPTSRDLVSILEEPDAEAAGLRLLERCAIGLEAGTAARSWPSDEVEAIGEAMGLADPLAEISLTFACPSCQHSSEEILDLPSFLWSEIETRAKRLLLEIHTLASAYGWAEAAVLGMSDIRRATYLQMVTA